MVKECLVIPTEILEQENILPRERTNQALYIPLSSVGGAENIYRLAALHGEYRERFGEQGVEVDPSFQQLIMYAFILKDNRFLAFQRGSAEKGQYDESRLEGKISLGLGGHIEPSDLSLEDSLFREVDEEAKLVINNRTEIDFHGDDKNLSINYMRNFLDITPVGLIKDERDEVGRVHLGIACRLTTKYSKSEMIVRTEGENVSFRYFTPEDYRSLTDSNQITPEGWSDIVFRNEILPSLTPPTYNPRG
ncbi:MAG: NUDIX domain-containing protein [Microgenomates group bacterium]|jgi:predicted NUDIX family phosphoesterase